MTDCNYHHYHFLEGELTLDVGPFAKAIEFAVGKPPITIGKPSKEFFETALKDIGISASEAIMVGDDIVSWHSNDTVCKTSCGFN